MGYFADPASRAPKRGVAPLALVLAAVIALVVITVAAFTLLAPAPAPEKGPVFKVTVSSGGELVANASVTAYDGQAVAGSAVTNAKGVASFENLPAKTLDFKVSKPGYRPVAQALDASQPNGKIELVSLVAPKKESLVTFDTKDKTTGAPVEGVSITLVVAGEKKYLSTSAEGSASVKVSFFSQVSAKFTKPGYRQQAVTILAGQDKITRSVELESELRAPRVGFETLETSPDTNDAVITPLYGTAVVTVMDIPGTPLQGAQAKAFDTATMALVASQSTDENGVAAFDNLPLGKNIFFTAFKEDYLPFDGSGFTMATEEAIAFEIRLEEATPLNSQVFRLVARDPDGNPLPAKVWIVAPPSSVLAEVEVNESGVEEFEAARDVTYYAYATSPGKTPAWSREFTAGQAVDLVFENASADNTAGLTLSVTDEDSRPVYGAIASMFTASGLFAGPSRVTDSQGTVSFEGLPIGDYEARVGYAQKTAGGSIALSESKTVNFTMELALATLEATAFDATTGQSMAASFVSYRYDAPFSTCSAPAESSCRLKVKAGVPVQVKATASGYLDFSASKTLEVDSRDNLTAVMIPSSAVVQPTIEFLNLTTLAGKPVAFVKPGGYYQAQFLVASPEESDSYGFYLRVGDADNITQEIAGIQEAPLEGTLAAAKSTTFKPSPECADLANDQEVNGALKWIDLSYEGAGSRIMNINIKVSENARATDKLRLRFRAYSMKGPVWSRTPVDEELGNAENSLGKAGCYAQVFSKDYEVVVPPAVSLSPEEVTQAKGGLTNELVVRWDPVTQTLQSPLKEIVLQVDPVMPADAIPISVNSSEVLIAAVESNSTPSTSGCYGIDEDKGMFWFKAREINPSCPISVRGDDIQGDEALLPVAYAAAPSHMLKIPIRVVAKSFGSLFMRPEGEDLGQCDSAKLIYVVNNKQFGLRSLSFEGFTGAYASTAGAERTQVTLDGPGVRAVVWRGPGVLDVTDTSGSGGAAAATGARGVLKEFKYDPAMDCKVRGKAYGTIGMPAVSCSNYQCCSENWCAKKAAQQALGLFKAEAPKVAEATAFRRGEGMPWQYFSPYKPFAFYTALQAKQGGASALQDSGVNASLGATCTADKPGVFELKAESQNGSEWSYSAKPVELKSDSYVEQSGRESAPASQELCGYLYGAQDTVATSNTSNEFTWQQVTKFEVEVNVCMFPIFQGWSPICAVHIPLHPRASVLYVSHKDIENEGTDDEGIAKVVENLPSQESISAFGLKFKEGAGDSWQAMQQCGKIETDPRSMLFEWGIRSLDWLLAEKGKSYKSSMLDWIDSMVPIAYANCGEGCKSAGNACNCRGVVGGVISSEAKGMPGNYIMSFCNNKVTIRINVGLKYEDCYLNFAPDVSSISKEAARYAGVSILTYVILNRIPTVSCLTDVNLPIPGDKVYGK
jgi:hypothetical protein